VLNLLPSSHYAYMLMLHEAACMQHGCVCGRSVTFWDDRDVCGPVMVHEPCTDLPLYNPRPVLEGGLCEGGRGADAAADDVLGHAGLWLSSKQSTLSVPTGMHACMLQRRVSAKQYPACNLNNPAALLQPSSTQPCIKVLGWRTLHVGCFSAATAIQERIITLFNSAPQPHGRLQVALLVTCVSHQMSRIQTRACKPCCRLVRGGIAAARTIGA
jgi:hypothetical protein